MFNRCEGSDELVEFAKDLIRVRSENPPGDQHAIADILESKMKEIGLQVDRYDFEPGKPNVVGKLTGRNPRPVLLFNGHVDTVPAGDIARWRFNPFEPIVKDGRLYGRGAADMKGGLAAMIYAAKSIVETEPDLNGTLLVTCVVDEEVTGYGTKSLLDRGYTADFAVVGEPTELAVLTSHKGALEFNVNTRGRSAHGSTPRKGLNAVYKMSKVCLAIEKYLNELEKTHHPLVGSPSISVGMIHGGTALGVVPDNCEIRVERRTVPGESLDDARGDLEALFKTLVDEDPELKLDWKVTLEVDASETPSESPVVKSSVEAVSEVTRSSPVIKGFLAVCDMRFLVNQGKIPTVILGPGSLDQAHVTDEYVETQQLIDSAKIYHLIARKLLG